MKKVVITYLIIFLIPTLLFGQEQAVQKDTASFCRHSFSAELGINRALINGSRYNEPIPLVGADVNSNKYAGFTKFPSFGLQLNIHYDYAINPRIRIKSGLSFSNRRMTYKSDSITLAVIEQDNSHIQFTKPYIVKYQYNPINLEIPVYIGYELSRFSVYLGLKTKIAVYNMTTTKDINQFEQTSNNFEFNIPKKNDSYFIDLVFYYHFIKTKFYLNLFSGIEIGSSGAYFNVGINVPIKKLN